MEESGKGLCRVGPLRKIFLFLRTVHAEGWNSVLTGKQAEDLGGKYDIIFPKRWNLYIEIVFSHYEHTFFGEQFDRARGIISRRYPKFLEACYDLKSDPFLVRLIGRISERLFDVWINKDRLKYKEIDCIYFDENNIYRMIWGTL